MKVWAEEVSGASEWAVGERCVEMMEPKWEMWIFQVFYFKLWSLIHLWGMQVEMSGKPLEQLDREES